MPRKFLSSITLDSGLVTAAGFDNVHLGDDISEANQNGSILFVDSNGKLAQAGDDGLLRWDEAGKALYIGGPTLDGAIGIYSSANGSYFTLVPGDSLFFCINGNTANPANVQFGEFIAGAGSFSGSIAVYSADVAGDLGVILRKGLAQTLDLLKWTSNNGATTYGRIDKDGYFITSKTAAPADGDLSAGELAIWFDPTNGAAKVKFKAKETGGTVRTGEVALS